MANGPANVSAQYTMHKCANNKISIVIYFIQMFFMVFWMTYCLILGNWFRPNEVRIKCLQTFRMNSSVAIRKTPPKTKCVEKNVAQNSKTRLRYIRKIKRQSERTNQNWNLDLWWVFAASVYTFLFIYFCCFCLFCVGFFLQFFRLAWYLHFHLGVIVVCFWCILCIFYVNALQAATAAAEQQQQQQWNERKIFMKEE